jgi:exonuclease V
MSGKRSRSSTPTNDSSLSITSTTITDDTSSTYDSSSSTTMKRTRSGVVMTLMDSLSQQQPQSSLMLPPSTTSTTIRFGNEDIDEDEWKAIEQAFIHEEATPPITLASSPSDVITSSLDSIPDIEQIASVSASSNSSTVTSSSPEVIRTPLQRFKGNRAISVTELCSQLWCEQQFHYSRTLKLRRSPEVEKVMNIGSQRHEQLQRDEQGDVIPLKLTKREDDWGLRLLTMLQGIFDLHVTGRTRELPVIGRVLCHGQYVWIMGIIDSIERVPLGAPPPSSMELDASAALVKRSLSSSSIGSSMESKVVVAPSTTNMTKSQASSSFSPLEDSKRASLPTSSSPSLGTDDIIGATPDDIPHRFRLIDNKTRARAQQPTIAQKRTSRMQLCIYKYLFDQLSSTPTALPLADMLTSQGYNLDTPFGTSLMQHIRDAGVDVSTKGHLRGLLSLLLPQLARLPLADDIMIVEYEHQASQKSLGSHVFTYDDISVRNDMDWLLQYWIGQRTLLDHATFAERWKCRYCEYHAQCNVSPLPKPITNQNDNSNTTNSSTSSSSGASTNKPRGHRRPTISIVVTDPVPTNQRTMNTSAAPVIDLTLDDNTSNTSTATTLNSRSLVDLTLDSSLETFPL